MTDENFFNQAMVFKFISELRHCQLVVSHCVYFFKHTFNKTPSLLMKSIVFINGGSKHSLHAYLFHLYDTDCQDEHYRCALTAESSAPIHCSNLLIQRS